MGYNIYICSKTYPTLFCSFFFVFFYYATAESSRVAIRGADVASQSTFDGSPIEVA